MLRRVALARKAMRPWKRKSSDRVTPAVGNYVAARDNQCVLATLDPEHVCRDQFGNLISPKGQYELDHVDNGGTGKRGPSTRDNLVRLCPFAHRLKTENASRYRPMLRAYLAVVEKHEEAA
jgi:hypothetical protein